jgi:non-specific protein-tyrosine kinase
MINKIKEALEKVGAVEALSVAGAETDPSVETRSVASEARVSRKEINPMYSRTRTLQVDPRWLRRNRIVSLSKNDPVRDQMRILHTQVLNRMQEIGARTLMVTSANPREGKTLTSINLAISLSQKLDQTVLLVDADLRKPTVHQYMGFEILAGLTACLLGQAEIPELLVNPGIEKLVILPGGAPLPNSSELLGSPAMEALVAELKERYADRVVVIDTSSLLACADPLVLSRFVDAVLLVVECERTSGRDLEKALELLKDSKIVGTVFNKAKE